MTLIFEQLLAKALAQLQAEEKVPSSVDSTFIKIDRIKNTAHGDFTSNLAFLLSKVCNKPAQQIAQWIVAALPAHACIEKIEIAGFGFINFFIKAQALPQIVSQVLLEGEAFGCRQMDIDLDLRDMPMQYIQHIQYGHARICSVFRQLSDYGVSFDEKIGLSQLSLLTTPMELSLLVLLARYPEMVALASNTSEPRQIAFYLQELAKGLHRYYNEIQLLCEDEMQRQARMCLLVAVRHVLKNGLQLLGVSSPESV